MVSNYVGYIAMLYYLVLVFCILAAGIAYQFIVRSELGRLGYANHNAFKRITEYHQVVRCLSKMPKNSVKRSIVNCLLKYERIVLRHTLLSLTGGLILGGVAFVLSSIGI
jgi:hypothetical protein